MSNKIKAKYGLLCEICGGRMYIEKGELGYKICNCNLIDVFKFIKNKFLKIITN